MSRFLGYSLTSIGFLGFFFFLKHRGTMIPLKELWFVLSIFIIVVGSYFFAKYKLQKLNKKRSDNNSNNRLAEIEHLKRTGHKVRVTLDNAEVKTRSYHEQIISDALPSYRIADALYDSNRNYKTQEIEQTYLLFHKTYIVQIC